MNKSLNNNVKGIIINLSSYYASFINLNVLHLVFEQYLIHI